MEKHANWATDYLDKELDKNFQVIRPRMPQQDNASYKEWKIIFEKYVALLGDQVILMGNSRGGLFLAKYLSENKFPKKIVATFLTCPPYGNNEKEREVVGDFKLKPDLSLIERNSPDLTLSFSIDDECVPVYTADQYRKKLPNAKICIYKDKCGHFKCSTFPEIIKQIKASVKKN